MSDSPSLPSDPRELEDALQRVAQLVAANERDVRRRQRALQLALEERAAELDDIARGLSAAAAQIARERERLQALPAIVGEPAAPGPVVPAPVVPAAAAPVAPPSAPAPMPPTPAATPAPGPSGPEGTAVAPAPSGPEGTAAAAPAPAPPHASPPAADDAAAPDGALADADGGSVPAGAPEPDGGAVGGAAAGDALPHEAVDGVARDGHAHERDAATADGAGAADLDAPGPTAVPDAEPAGPDAGPGDRDAPSVGPAPADAGPADGADGADGSGPSRPADDASDDEMPVVAESTGGVPAADPPEKLDGARIVALSMAAGGSTRDEVDAYVRDELGITDRQALLDYVFGTSAPASVVPSWPPRRRRRGAR